MKVKVLTVDTPNQNNRVYPRHVIENAIQQALPKVREKRFFVTTQIPALNDEICPTDVGGLVTEFTLEGNDLMVEIEFLDNYNGLRLLEGVNNGDVGICISGYGALQENEAGINVVQPDYEIAFLSATNDPA